MIAVSGEHFRVKLLQMELIPLVSEGNSILICPISVSIPRLKGKTLKRFRNGQTDRVYLLRISKSARAWGWSEIWRQSLISKSLPTIKLVKSINKLKIKVSKAWASMLKLPQWSLLLVELKDNLEELKRFFRSVMFNKKSWLTASKKWKTWFPRLKTKFSWMPSKLLTKLQTNCISQWMSIMLLALWQNRSLSFRLLPVDNLKLLLVLLSSWFLSYQQIRKPVLR